MSTVKTQGSLFDSENVGNLRNHVIIIFLGEETLAAVISELHVQLWRNRRTFDLEFRNCAAGCKWAVRTGPSVYGSWSRGSHGVYCRAPRLPALFQAKTRARCINFQRQRPSKAGTRIIFLIVHFVRALWSA